MSAIIRKHIMTVDITEVSDNQRRTYYVDITGKKGTSNFATDSQESIADRIVQEMRYFSTEAPIPNPYIV